jgi:hypothetical protein
MEKNKKLSSFDLTDELKEKDMLLVRGGLADNGGEVNACHSGTCNINVSCKCKAE